MPIAILQPVSRPVTSAFALRQLFGLVFLGLSAVLAASSFSTTARAEESPTLIIPANDGYGFEECLKTGSTCGLVVADAWCKAHGFAGSKEFRPAGAKPGVADAPPGSFQVTCGGRLD